MCNLLTKIFLQGVDSNNWQKWKIRPFGTYFRLLLFMLSHFSLTVYM